MTFLKKNRLKLLFCLTISLLLFINIPSNYLNIFSQQQKIEITATATNNNLSKGHEIWITSIFNNSSIKLNKYTSTDWIIKNNNLVFIGKQPSTLTINLPANEKSKISLIKHQWSGIVSIKTPTTQQNYDLYNPKGDNLTITVPPLNFSSTVPIYQQLLNLVVNIIIFLLLCLFIYVSTSIFQNLSLVSPLPSSKLKKYSFLVFLISFFSGIIYLLAFYPGLLTPDSYDQWSQMTIFKFSDWHPVFHTLLLFYLTRIYYSPVTIAVTQILIFSFANSIVAFYLLKKGIKPFVILLTFFIFSISLVNGLMLITLWKDVLFSLLLYLCTICLVLYCDGHHQYTRREYFFIIVLLIFTSLVRHNGIIPAFATLLAFIYFSNSKVKTSIVILIPIVIFITFFKLFFIPQVLHASTEKPPTSLNQFMLIASVPNETEKIDPNDKQFINNIVSIKEIKQVYSPYAIDPLIFAKTYNANFYSQNNTNTFLLFFKFIYKYPDIIFNNWKKLTSIVWKIRPYPDSYTSTPPIQNYPSEYQNITYFNFATQPIFVPLNNLLTQIYLNSKNYPFFLLLWRPATHLILLLVCCFIWVLKSDIKKVLCLVPVITNTISLLILIPAQDFRYLYATFLAIPVFLLLALTKPSSS